MQSNIAVLILSAILLISSCSSHPEYVGMPIDDARALASERGLPHRVVKVDGKHRWRTMDDIPDRLDFYIRNGKVVRVTND